MRKSRLLSLAVLPLLLLPGAGLCGGIPDCRTIAAILSVYPPMEVRISEGPVRSPRDDIARSGCRVEAHSPHALISGEVDPAEALRSHFAGSGWEEDARLPADGPGITSIAFRKAGILCRGTGGVRPGVEGGRTSPPDRYEIAVECASWPD